MDSSTTVSVPSGSPRGPGLLATIVLMTVFSVCFVGGRIFRCVKTRRFGFEDALIVAALMLSFALSGVLIFCVHGGYGRHLVSFVRDGTLEIVIEVLKVAYFGPAIILWASMLAKLALGATLLRLGFDRGFQILVCCIMSCTVVFNLWPSIDSLVGCNSRGESTAPTEGCKNSAQLSLIVLLYVSSAANTAIDLAYVILLEIYLWRVKLSARDRLAIRVVLFFTLTATVCSAARLALYDSTVESPDVTYAGVPVAALGVADVNLSLCAASLPAVRQLFGRYFPKHFLFWRAAKDEPTTGWYGKSTKGTRLDDGTAIDDDDRPSDEARINKIETVNVEFEQASHHGHEMQMFKKERGSSDDGKSPLGVVCEVSTHVV